VLAVGNVGDLADGNFSQFVHEWGGHGLGVAINVAIAIAILNAVIVMVLQNGRVVFASARDKCWPAAANEVLTRLHPRFGTPWIATLAVGVPGALLAEFVNVESLLGITSIVLAVMYVVIAVASIRGRRLPSTVASWKMPLFPLAPLLVIVAVGYAVVGSAASDLLITGAILIAAMAYYVLYLARRPHDRFIVFDPADDPTPAP
jgi:amino acid transporter